MTFYKLSVTTAADITCENSPGLLRVFFPTAAKKAARGGLGTRLAIINVCNYACKARTYFGGLGACPPPPPPPEIFRCEVVSEPVLANLLPINIIASGGPPARKITAHALEVAPPTKIERLQVRSRPYNYRYIFRYLPFIGYFRVAKEW